MDEALSDRGESAFTLQLTAPQLKITHAALRSLLLDLGHDEHDVRRIVHDVLAKLPGDAEVRAIDISAELARSRAAAAVR